MPSLDNIADTGIFSQGPDGSFGRQFAPVNEGLMAQQFAIDINSGKMSVRDAWEKYWSYREEPELWDLPENLQWRAVLQSWRTVIVSFFPELKPEFRKAVIDVVAEPYFKAKESLPRYRFNPFVVELEFSLGLVGKFGENYPDGMGEKEIARYSKAEKPYLINEGYITIIPEFSRIDCIKSLISREVAKDRKHSMHRAYEFSDMVAFDPILLVDLKKDDFYCRSFAVETLARFGQYDERMIHYMKDNELYIDCFSALSLLTARQGMGCFILREMKKIYGLKSFDCPFFPHRYEMFIRSIHRQCKPKGYLPQETSLRD